MSLHLKAHRLIFGQLQQEVGALPLTWTFPGGSPGFTLTTCCQVNTLPVVELGKAIFSAYLQSTGSARRSSLQLGQ